jgi:hypothetical protein
MDEPLKDPLRDLLAEVAATQREQLRHAGVLAEVRARVAAPPAPPPRRARAWLAAPALAACAGAAALVLWTTRPAPLSFSSPATGFVSAPGRVLEADASAAVPVDFSDGSRVALEPGARVTVEALAAAGATVALERGRADVHVRHRERTHWVVKAGPARVAVTGTRFWVSWDPALEELDVELREGSVVVSDAPGTTGPERLRAGQTLRAWGRRAAFEIVDTAPGAVVDTAPRAVVDTSPGAVEAPGGGAGPARAALAPASAPGLAPAPTTAAAGPRARARAEGAGPSLASFRELAAKARYAEALRAAERVGFASACETLGGDDLVLLGDVARLAGAPARAEEAYRAARRRFPDVDRASFALGVTEFDQRRRYAEAAGWFETYLAQYPSGPLAREAAGRLVEARQRGGDAAGAREAARAYLARYPSGPHAALAHQILGP